MRQYYKSDKKKREESKKKKKEEKRLRKLGRENEGQPAEGQTLPPAEPTADTGLAPDVQ